MSKDNQPFARIKSGAISASIWEHQGGKRGNFYTVQVQRVYTPDDGKTWSYTDALDRDDAPVAASLLLQAHAMICGVELEAADARAELQAKSKGRGV